MLKTTCTICGMRRKYKTLAFDNELNAYCSSPAMCSSNHPNSVQNCKQRGSYLNLLDSEQAQKEQLNYYQHSYEQMARSKNKRVRDVSMQALITGTISFRIANEDQAQYLAFMLAKLGTNKITDVIQQLLNDGMSSDMDFKNRFIAQYRGENLTQSAPLPEPKPKQTPQQEEQEQDSEDVFSL